MWFMKTAFRTAGVWLGLAAGIGCEGVVEPVPSEVERPDVREWVTGAAADALDPDGRFVLAPLPPVPGMPLVSLEWAGELAFAAVRSLQDALVPPGFESLLDFMERTHGGPIDWSNVELGRTVGYSAESPFEPLPDSLVSPWRRRFAPHHIVGVWVGGRQVAAVSVSAFTGDYEIDPSGRIISPQGSGGTFRFLGVHRSVVTHHPLHPEEAVREVGLQTGARVTEVPRLVMPGVGISAHGSSWALELDREVEFEAVHTTARIRSRRVHLAASPSGGPIHWLVPMEEQPTEEVFHYVGRTPEPCPCEFEDREVVLQVRRDVPIKFHHVRPLR
jgi:hypothetical protein